MMNHQECLEYFAENMPIDFPKNDVYIERSDLTRDWSEEYLWIADGACYPLPDYVGDALINWHKMLNQSNEDSE
jgi:hypothetical protein